MSWRISPSTAEKILAGLQGKLPPLYTAESVRIGHDAMVVILNSRGAAVLEQRSIEEDNASHISASEVTACQLVTSAWKNFLSRGK